MSIMGHPGSGKTFMAEAVAKKLSIPHVHLDRFWLGSGGADVNKNTSESDKEKIRTHVRQKALEAISAESWVSDGSYTRTMPEIAQRADVIIFLDIPLWRRLLNHGGRIFKPWTRHKELSMWHELSFFAEIIRREYKNSPRLKKFISEHKDKVVVLKSRKEIDRYLQELH